MNEHIELVKKWLADPKSVTQKELDENAKDACAAYRAAYWATEGIVDGAEYWVEEYEELTNNKNKRA